MEVLYESCIIEIPSSTKYFYYSNYTSSLWYGCIKYSFFWTAKLSLWCMWHTLCFSCTNISYFLGCISVITAGETVPPMSKNCPWNRSIFRRKIRICIKLQTSGSSYSTLIYSNAYVMGEFQYAVTQQNRLQDINFVVVIPKEGNGVTYQSVLKCNL